MNRRSRHTSAPQPWKMPRKTCSKPRKTLRSTRGSKRRPGTFEGREPPLPHGSILVLLPLHRTKSSRKDRRNRRASPVPEPLLPHRTFFPLTQSTRIVGNDNGPGHSANTVQKRGFLHGCRVSAGSRMKIKYDPELRAFTFSRSLVMGLRYPF